MNNYITLLREHNLKATPQRLAIVDALLINGHMSTDSLYHLMIEKFHSISLATIYKNINLMLENSFIQEVKIPHAKSVYELTKENHAHLICEKCGAISDLDLDLYTLVENAAKKTNFKIMKTDLVSSGICKNCQ